MIPLPLLDQLMARASKLLAESDLAPELQTKSRVVLQSVLAKMDLVTREEFDAQTAVLQRSRAKLEALETEVEKLLAAQQLQSNNESVD